MARISGVDLPNNKAVEYGLTAIFGVGLFTSRKVCRLTDIDPAKKVSELTDDDIANIRKVLEEEFTIEGSLRTEISMNIKRLVEIQSYRGMRHRRNLPVRGQNCKNNARTRKGPKKSIANKKK
ncbi:MAG: 30S ribosomal protein S13 [Fibrobacterales bacterium]